MYQTYLWKIKPISSYMTPWQSDTIYGHFLWGIFFLYGEEELNKIISDFENYNSPFIISDGFLDGRLPMIKKGIIKREENKEIADSLNMNLADVIKKRKIINKISEISLEEFNKLRGSYSNKEFVIEKLKEKEISKTSSSIQTLVMHNIINRLSGSTVENGIFTSKEIFTDKDIWIFIKVRNDFPIEKIEKILKFIEENGYGKKISVGKGAFKTVSFEKFDKFTKIENSNGFIVLSNYIPKPYDFSEVIYETPLVKFGKVANFGNNAEVPFKKTFSCFKVGSIFKNGDNKNIGKVLKNIHYDKRIVQIGIPFTLEMIV